MTIGYFPLDLTDHTARHGKPIPCRACNQPWRISYLKHGYCPTCWAKAEKLWTRLDKLALRLQIEGRGRTPEADHVRDYCKEQRRKVKKELKALGLPLTRPSDKRVYGPGQARWQKAG